MKVVSATRLSGLTGPLDAEGYVFRLLMERAVSKLGKVSAHSLVMTATWALRDAGKWTDDVRIDVSSLNPVKVKGKCVRLLHGIPSPRMWGTPSAHYPQMAAKDAIYFFQPNDSDRQGTFYSLAPSFGTEAELADWLTNFSTTRFEKQLVQALVASQDERIYQTLAKIGQSEVFKRIACVGAEIDRLAWFTGQRSMTLANAAPVWRPGK